MLSIEFTLPIFTQLITLFLGIFVFLSNPKARLNRIFVLLILCGLFWVFSVFLADLIKDYKTVLFWTKVAILGPTFIGPLFYYFSLIFPRQTKKLSSLQKASLFLPPVILLILSPTSLNVQSVNIQDWGTDFVPGPLYLFLLTCLVLYFLFAFNNLRKAYALTTLKIERYQILYLSGGLLAALIIGVFTNLIFPIAGYAELSKYGPSFSVLLFAFLTSISILRHHLLNVKVIFTEALVLLLIGTLAIKIPISRTSSEFIFNILILILTAIVGYYLVRVTIQEIQKREQIEKMDKELKRAYKELKKLDIAKSEFISIASHQLRTPLTAIKGYASLIGNRAYGEFPGKMQKPLRNISSSVERLIKLVNDLLSISRIEAGKIKVEPEEFLLENLIDNVLDELGNLSKAKKLYLKWRERAEAPLAKVFLDKAKIRQVVLNIVDNAIKYTQAGGVTISYKQENGLCRIEIKDTGEGMTRAEISNSFKTFSRGVAGKKTWTEGAGLGLYIAKNFTEMHNGRIWIESTEKKKGSTFYIELPIKYERKS